MFLSFLSLQLHSHAVVVFHLRIDIKNKIISNLSSKDKSVTKFKQIIRTQLFKNNSTRLVVDG